MTEGIPAPLWAKLKAFLRDGKTGQFTLEVKDGRVLAYKVTEYGRLDLAPPVAEQRQAC